MTADPRAAADLAALVRESVAAGATREVLHLRLSAAAAPHHRRLLRDALAPAYGAARTRIFELPNGDVVAVAPPAAPALEAAAAALRRSLEGTDHAALARLRLPEAAAAVLGAAAESLGLSPHAPQDAPRGGVLTSASLAAAERDLAQADLAPFTIRHAVCRLEPGGRAARLWEEVRIDKAGIAAAILPGVALDEGPLARRLHRLLEVRLLAGLARPEAWRPLGLPLLPATVLGAAFRRFDAALPAAQRRHVTIGFRAADILRDMTGFLAARDALRGGGYRLALDDAPARLLDVLPQPRLGLDVVRLRWTEELPAGPPTGLARLLAAPGAAARVVLVGVDRAAAIAWGWEAGLRLFSGPLLERRATPP
jgi:hypothetical protein